MAKIFQRVHTKKFYRKEPSALKILFGRITIIVVLLFVIAIVFWTHGEKGIEDTQDGELSFIDSLYFTIVTVTTLGYGDIVPVSQGARMFDAFIITPVRMFIWITFIGTAYQLVIQKYWERFRMNKNLMKMEGHVLIAGYGTTGATTLKELLLRNYNVDDIIVIDRNETRVKEAAQDGATGLVGDCTREDILIRAGVGKASALIITLPHDDTNVLITLTANDLNPNLKIITRVGEKENIKQLRRAGADIMLSPSLTCGNLMAMAISDGKSAEMMGDLLTTSRGVNVVQRRVKEEEVGKMPKRLKGMVVIDVISRGKNVGPISLDTWKLKKGDVIIFIG